MLYWLLLMPYQTIKEANGTLQPSGLILNLSENEYPRWEFRIYDHTTRVADISRSKRHHSFVKKRPSAYLSTEITNHSTGNLISLRLDDPLQSYSECHATTASSISIHVICIIPTLDVMRNATSCSMIPAPMNWRTLFVRQLTIVRISAVHLASDIIVNHNRKLLISRAYLSACVCLSARAKSKVAGTSLFTGA